MGTTESDFGEHSIIEDILCVVTVSAVPLWIALAAIIWVLPYDVDLPCQCIGVSKEMHRLINAPEALDI